MKPFKSIDEIKVGMRVVPIGGNNGQQGFGPGIVIAYDDSEFVIKHAGGRGYWSHFKFWAPEVPIFQANAPAPITTPEETNALFTFFRTPLSDNTCICGAPKPCKYHS